MIVGTNIVAYTTSDYQLTATGVCYRTEIAACIKYMRLEDWQNYVLGYSTEGMDEQRTEDIIQTWIHAYIKEANLAIEGLEGIDIETIGHGHHERVQMLLRRWRQIKDLCETASTTVSC